MRKFALALFLLFSFTVQGNANNVKELKISNSGNLSLKEIQTISKWSKVENLELIVTISDQPDDLTDGYHKNENLPAPYSTDFIILDNIGKNLPLSVFENFLQHVPNMKKCTFKNIAVPCSLSFDVPDRLWIYDKRMFKRGFKASISLQEGMVCFEALETLSKEALPSYHLIYDIGYSKDPLVLGLLKDAIYIGPQALHLTLEKNQSTEFTIPKQLRYIDSSGLYLLGNVNVKIEESDVPLVISGAGIAMEGVIKKFEFNRPVYLCDSALPYSEVKELIFNNNVEYLGNKSFNKIETVRFKECPKKMGTIVEYPKVIQRAYVPSSSRTQFNNFGVSYIKSVIGTKEQGNLANTGEQTEQMKAIEEGRLLPSYDFIQKNIRILAPNQGWMLSLCKEDALAYTGRNNMDELDKSLYLKSEDYQTDLNSLQEDRNSVFAYMHNLDNDGYMNNKAFWVEFEADAMTFNCLNINNETNLKFAHIGIGQIAFPVQPVVTKAEWASGYYYFPCSDIYALKKVKDNLGHIAFVILFKPAFAKETSSANIFLQTKDVGVVNPIAMYIVDKKSGEVLLNLSEYIRDISSEAGYKAEMALIENINKKEKALQDKWDREYREAEAKKTYHKVPKEERCWVCGGSGTITSDGIPIKRCANCYGRGYTLEYRY